MQKASPESSQGGAGGGSRRQRGRRPGRDPHSPSPRRIGGVGRKYVVKVQPEAQEGQGDRDAEAEAGAADDANGPSEGPESAVKSVQP